MLWGFRHRPGHRFTTFPAPGSGTGPKVPVITTITPATGKITGGTAVTLTGSHFTGATAVHFGTSLATTLVVVATTSITVKTPSHLPTGATVNVTVTTPIGTSGPISFFYINVAIITTITPTSGSNAGGTSVTIHGKHFTAGTVTGVNFGTTAATTVVKVSTTVITCKAPAHATGKVKVTVFTTAGTAQKATGFTYFNPTPFVAVAAPLTLAGGATVVLTVNRTCPIGDTLLVPHRQGGSASNTCVDSKGNTYILDAGVNVTGAIAQCWRTRITTPLVSGDTITLTSFSTGTKTAIALLYHLIVATPLVGNATSGSGTLPRTAVVTPSSGSSWLYLSICAITTNSATTLSVTSPGWNLRVATLGAVNRRAWGVADKFATTTPDTIIWTAGSLVNADASITAYKVT